MLPSLGERLLANSIQVSPTDHAFIRKGIKDNFIVDKDLNPVIKFNTTNKETKG